MPISTQSHVSSRACPSNVSIIKQPGLRALVSIGGIALLGAVSLPVRAGTLISSSDYLEYELPKNVQQRCAERQRCPEIEIKYLHTNYDWINKITNARIDNLVVNSKPSESASITMDNTNENSTAVKAAIDDFAKSQLTDLPDDSAASYSLMVYSLMVTPEYLGHVEVFELFKIHSYVFTGGAHGMSYSEYLIFDLSSKKQVQLADMLQSGKKSRFEKLAYDAYKTWVKTVDEDVSSYEKNWPFTLSDNVTLTDKGLDIQYQHYSIGPYAYGMPVLSIPYHKLHGIIKPYFIPKFLSLNKDKQ